MFTVFIANVSPFLASTYVQSRNDKEKELSMTMDKITVEKQSKEVNKDLKAHFGPDCKDLTPEETQAMSKKTQMFKTSTKNQSR